MAPNEDEKWRCVAAGTAAGLSTSSKAALGKGHYAVHDTMNVND